MPLLLEKPVITSTIRVWLTRIYGNAESFDKYRIVWTSQDSKFVVVRLFNVDTPTKYNYAMHDIYSASDEPLKTTGALTKKARIELLESLDQYKINFGEVDEQ